MHTLGNALCVMLDCFFFITEYLSLFKLASPLHHLEIYEIVCITHISPFMGFLDQEIEVKSFKSFYISFFSLSLFFHTLSFSPSLTFFLSIFPSYCISMDIYIHVFLKIYCSGITTMIFLDADTSPTQKKNPGFTTIVKKPIKKLSILSINKF